jgi:hypothetical protein
MKKLYKVYEQWDRSGRSHTDEYGRPQPKFVGEAATFADAKLLTRFPIMEVA